MQLTTGSLAGLFGRRSREVAEQFLWDGIVECSPPTRTRPVAALSRSRKASLCQRIGWCAPGAQLTQAKPGALLADQPLPPPVDRLCPGNAPNRDGGNR